MTTLDIDAIINKNYGDGCYHRHIVIDISDNNKIFAALEDDPHAFSITLEISDAGLITAADGHWQRHPTTTCGGAPSELSTLIGKKIGTHPFALADQTNALDQCTHLFDLTSVATRLYALKASGQSTQDRYYYKLQIPDAVDGQQTATLTLANQGNEPLLTWKIDNGVITSPAAFANRPVLKGLIKWARAELDEQSLMHTIMLQKGFFVARGREYLLEKLDGVPCLKMGQPQDVCYAMRHGRENLSLRTGSRIDCGKQPNAMLSFVENLERFS